MYFYDLWKIRVNMDINNNFLLLLMIKELVIIEILNYCVNTQI